MTTISISRTVPPGNQATPNSLATFILDAPAGTPVTISIPEAGVDTSVKTDANGNGIFTVKASNLTLWSPESPRLYKVIMALGQDTLADDIGFRDIRVDGTRILLNGKAVFLKGVNVHAEALTSALNSAHIQGGTATLDDPFADVLDVVGINEYIGWYTGTPEYADSLRWVVPHKPIIMSEFGAEAKFGNHGPATERWTEEQQASVYRHQLAMFPKIPELRGIAPWVLFDFRSTTRNIPVLQDGYNRKGLASDNGKKNRPLLSSKSI